MIIMIVREIAAGEYRELITRYLLIDFIQTPENSERLATGGRSLQYCKVMDGGRVVAVCVLYIWTTPLGLEYECLRGPVMSYGNAEEVELVFIALRQYVQQRGGLRFRIQPLIRESYGEDGASMNVDDKGRQAMEALRRAGFKEAPRSVVYRNDRYQQWFFVKDLSGHKTYDTLVKTLSAKTQRDMQLAARQGVMVRLAKTKDDIDRVAALMIKTGERRQFDGRSRQFYHNLYKAFSRAGIRFFLAEIDASKYRQYLIDRMESLELSRNDATDAAIRDIDDQQRAIRQRLALISSSKGGQIPLAAAIFIHIGKTMVYFLSASDKRFAFLAAPYAIQEQALQQALRLGVQRYDFYGTNGKFNGRPEQEGIYRFKKGFGGQLERYAGCYGCTLRPVRCALLDTLRYVKRFIS